VHEETAGYSSTPLVRKLGLKPGMTVYVDVAACGRMPEAISGLEETLEVGLEIRGTVYTTHLPRSLDMALLFCPDRARLEKRLPVVLDTMTAAGAVWVCWPKKASGVVTDLSDAAVREAGLAAGVVDVKVAAVDQVWSGLKFVRRLADRI